MLQLLGLTDGDRLLATPFAVVCGLTYNFLPFMTLPLYATLERIDPRLLEAGGDLYATPFTAFRKVTFPLSLPGVVAGTLLTFIPAAGDYINAKLLGNTEHHDDRQGHRRAVPARARLPDRRRAVVHADGCRSWCWSSSTSAGPGRRSWSDGHRYDLSRAGRLRSPWPPRRDAAWAGDLAARARHPDRRVLAFVYMLLPNVVVIAVLVQQARPAGSTTTWTQFSTRRLAATRAARRACASRSR